MGLRVRGEATGDSDAVDGDEGERGYMGDEVGLCSALCFASAFFTAPAAIRDGIAATLEDRGTRSPSRYFESDIQYWCKCRRILY